MQIYYLKVYHSARRKGVLDEYKSPSAFLTQCSKVELDALSGEKEIQWEA